MTAQVTLTGTGIPLPAPGRAGPGTLVSVGNRHLQFDIGRASVLRLTEAGVACSQVSTLFLTHHHSDHLVGFADYVITRWIQSQTEPIVVVAPQGPAGRFAKTAMATWDDDIELRRRYRREHGRPDDPPNLDIRVFEARPEPSVVWESGGVTVRAVSVHHEPVVPAVGYRVDSPDGSVVISGDTRVCGEIELLAQDAEVLVHEVVRASSTLDEGVRFVHDYHADAAELGAMATRARVGALVLSHLLPPPKNPDEEQMFADQVRQGGWDGPLLVGRDLDVIPVRGGLPRDLAALRRR